MFHRAREDFHMTRSYDDAFAETADRMKAEARTFFSLAPEDRLVKVARILDEAVRIPFIGLRVGLDPVFSAIPVVGSLFGVVLSSYYFWEAYNLRVPWHVYPRMAINIGVDALLGAIPVAGVFADALWKANVRNRNILMRYAERRRAYRRPREEAAARIEVLDKK
jgi:hypothetical protein